MNTAMFDIEVPLTSDLSKTPFNDDFEGYGDFHIEYKPELSWSSDHSFEKLDDYTPKP